MIQRHITGSGQEIVFEPSPKWVRLLFGGEFIADSKRVYLLFLGGGRLITIFLKKMFAWTCYNQPAIQKRWRPSWFFPRPQYRRLAVIIFASIIPSLL